MTITMNLWSVDNGELKEILKSRVALEAQLEKWVYNDPSLLNLDILIIGKQVHTAFGGYIDILAINREGDLVVIELKRDKTPRDIVAQCLDYASWVSDLGFEEIGEIFKKYEGKNIAEEFSSYFYESLPETLNEIHQIIVVATSLDDSTERIIDYLTEKHSVNINAVFFSVFDYKGSQIIGRSFFKDPEKVEEKSNQRKRGAWTGYLFVNTGIDFHPARDWSLNQKYGYISAGGERWVKMIKKLKPGDKIFAYIKGSGYVGYGIVEEDAVPVADFMVGNNHFVDLLPNDNPWKTQQVIDSEDEWLVRVNWINTVDRNSAKWIPNGFANQNVVCKLRDLRTFEFLKREFNVDIQT